MSVEIIALHNFRKEAKRLIKKYHSLKEELSLLESELRQNPHLGVELKKNTYNTLSISSKSIKNNLKQPVKKLSSFFYLFSIKKNVPNIIELKKKLYFCIVKLYKITI